MQSNATKSHEPRPERAGAPDGSGAGGSSILIERLEKTFRRQDGTEVRAVDHIDLEVAGGELLVLLGPSGCGKTTLLRSIAGLEAPSAGRVVAAGKVMFDSARRVNVPPEQRRIGMIFQSYALWPHMRVLANVAYPLRCRRVGRGEAEPRAREVLELLGIAELARQFPGQISGGQQQRVALARAIVAGEQIVLFDEPLSNVDAKVREQLRIEIVSMQRKLGFTGVYVTHDQDEAMGLATRIAVLESGKVAQIGTPQDIYRHPRSLYVARFVGTTNELEGTVRSVDGDRVTVETAIGPLQAADTGGPGPGDRVIAMTRPENVSIDLEQARAGPNRWEATIENSAFIGARSEYLLRVGDASFRVWRFGSDLIPAGDRAHVSIPAESVRLLPAA